MSTKSTKHLPKFYLHFTYKYQQCKHTVAKKNIAWKDKCTVFMHYVLFLLIPQFSVVLIFDFFLEILCEPAGPK